MPRALNGEVGAIDEAFAQWSSSMRTRVVQRVELPIYIEQGDRAAIDLDYRTLARCEI
jgi:hypothetical protein